jgi:hypothetical protein
VRSTLAQLLSLPSARVALGLAVALALALCCVPLFAVHGAESALVLGVCLPPMAAMVCARLTARLREQTGNVRPGRALELAVGYALLLFAAPTFVLLVDSARVRNCTPGLGFAFMLLGPGFGVVLASLVGVCCALSVRSARAASALAILVSLLPVGLGVLRFYASPAIFAYGHFYGYFPGTLYDEGVSITAPLLWLRVFTSLWIAGLALLVVSASDATSLRWSRPTRERRSGFAVALSCIALAAFAEVYAPELGHASSVTLIESALGGSMRSERCQLYFPRELSQHVRARLADDCDFRVWQAEHWLGLTHPAPISVFVFRSAQEKSALMGAAQTNLAKPWRSEVYISDSGWPNPVLGHELVHIVARGAGRGPLRIAGRALGLWPDLALIEGVAMAAAWQTQGGLTPHQWARAMLELGMTPRLSQLFGPSFLGQERSLAYTLCGSLLRFVADRHGSAAVREAYRTADLAAAVHLPLSMLEQQWHAYLRSVPLPGSALALARARFSGSSILSELCPHALAKLHDALDGSLAAGNDADAKLECTRILQIDATDAATRAALVAVLARSGAMQAAERELARLQKPPLGSPTFAARAQQALADESFRAGRLPEAAATYERLLQAPNDEESLRQLQVRALAAHAGGRQARLLFDLLVAEPGERTDPATAVHLARELRTERSDGLPSYLEARQLYFQKRFALAAPLLAEAQHLGLPTPELSAENLRLLAITRFATGELELSAQLFEQFAGHDNPGRAADAQDWLARITFTRSRVGVPPLL